MVAAGTPEEVARVKESYTGQDLRDRLGGARREGEAGEGGGGVDSDLCE